MLIDSVSHSLPPHRLWMPLWSSATKARKCWSEGADEFSAPSGAPKATAFAERWVRTVRHELLDRALIWNQHQVRHEAPSLPGGDERTPLLGCRSSPVKLRAA